MTGTMMGQRKKTEREKLQQLQEEVNLEEENHGRTEGSQEEAERMKKWKEIKTERAVKQKTRREGVRRKINKKETAR